MKLSWENVWMTFLLFFCIWVLYFFSLLILGKRETYRYSLGTSSAKLTITKEINWCPDDEIDLDRTVSYWDAIRMVDSLNKTLKK